MLGIPGCSAMIMRPRLGHILPALLAQVLAQGILALSWLVSDIVMQVILNGVLGWGVNSDAQIRQAVKAVHRVMRPNALLVIGYNDGMVECCNQFLPLFRPVDLGNLKQQNDMAESELHHVSSWLWL